MSEGLVLDELPSAPSIAEELAAPGPDDDVEITNLHEEDTGLKGVVFISSRMASRGPRVKYYLRKGSDDASYSVSVSATPRVVASSMNARDLNRTAPRALAWVALNHEALLWFWGEGESWSFREFVAFVAGLERV